MFYILHNWQPPNILLEIGPITLYWYGLIIAVAILLSYFFVLKISKYFLIKKDTLNDLFLWLIVWSIIGSRIYEIFLEWNYYLQNPSQILKIWEGGLAIHGAILAGLIVIYFYSKKYKINFWRITGLIAPGLALGQAIGRFGNWFNQELYGLPTNLPWAIPISIENRIVEFIDYQYFHPTFLYESIGNILIFIILITLIIRLKNKVNLDYLGKISFAVYLFLYSVLRFFIEFIRLDPTPDLFGLRWPQIFSLLMIIIVIIIIKPIIFNKKLTKENN